MKTLIIGGTGHVSGALARRCVSAGHRVWILTRGRRPSPAGVTALVADRHDEEAMAAAVEGAGTSWDMVVDCICYTPGDMDQDIRLFRGRAGRFILVSTDFVFDPARRRFPQPEEADSWVNPAQNPYGYDKRLCEKKLFDGLFDPVEWTVFRPCHIYGPPSLLGCLPLHGRDPDLLEKMRAGETLRLVDGGRFLQQPVSAEDLAATIASAAENQKCGGRVFNVAGPDIVESVEYYRIVAGVVGARLSVEEIPAGSFLAENPGRASFICHRIYDLKALRESGLAVPATPLAEGLRAHVDWFLENQS